MATLPFILVSYRAVELNPISGQRSNTPFIDCAQIDAEQCLVSLEGEGGTLAAALVVTLEMSVDGASAATLPPETVASPVLTLASPVCGPIDVSGIGAIRARVSTANGTASKGRIKFIFRRAGGFAGELATALTGGEGVLSGTSGVASGAPGSAGGALGDPV